MDFEKVRTSEWAALGGGALTLIAVLFLNWYSIAGTRAGERVTESFGALDHQAFTGTIADLVILGAGIAGVALAVLAGTSRTVALPVTASAICTQLGGLAVVMVLLRMLFQPGPNEIVDLEWGIWLALVGTALVTYGGWRSMQDDGAVSYADGDATARPPTAPPAAPSPQAPEDRGESPPPAS
jgi:hypothetical protein